MPTGTSTAYQLDVPPGSGPLPLDASYYLVRLHDAQAFFPAGWLVKAGYLLFSTTVQSSFQPDQPTQSLHRVATLQKNVPCHLGVSVNLTDWLPARSADTLHLSLRYTAVQDTPFKTLVDQMDKLGLVARVSVVRPDVAAAIKVSQIVGRLLSVGLGEGSQHEIFSLELDLNVSSLRTGYCAIVGSSTDERWPTGVVLDRAGRLVERGEYPLERLCYAVLEVLALERRGQEAARAEPWWEILQAGKDQALAAAPTTPAERQRVLAEWKSNLSRTRALARSDRAFLLSEIDQIIHLAELEVESSLTAIAAESSGLDAYPADWQSLLDVASRAELRESVADYQAALERSAAIASVVAADS